MMKGRSTEKSAEESHPEFHSSDADSGSRKHKKKNKKKEESSENKKVKLSKGTSSAEPEVNCTDTNEILVSKSVAENSGEASIPAPQKKKKKKKHAKSEADHNTLKGVDIEVSNDEQPGIFTEYQKPMDEENKDDVKKALPKMLMETCKKRELKSYLAGQGTTLKEWKKIRKEEYKMWKEQKQLKKIKLEESKAASDPKESPQKTSGKGVTYTVSIALPGSILDNAQSPELKTYLAGQIARAAAIFNVNEIVVFEETTVPSRDHEEGEGGPLRLWRKYGCSQMCNILRFLECPQYLRKYFFPLQKDLEYAGVLNPLDMPHHLRVDDVSPYRDGVVLNKPVREGKGSYAYIGFQKSAVIDRTVPPNVRVTIKLDEKKNKKKHFVGIAVPPTAPYKEDGIYWGYSVRQAESLGAVFAKCPFKGGYDLTIGTSDKGNNVDHCVLPPFKHLLIVFGGLKGLEGSLDADETLTVEDPSFLFHHYLNTCPSQGSRTIRTEEAILITLSILRPKILQCQGTA